MRRTRLTFLSLAIVPFLAACSGIPKGTTTTNSVTVTVSPGTMTLETFEKQTFSATITGSSNSAVTWQVNGVTGGSTTTGGITSAGVYSAPHYLSSSIIPSNGAATTVTITAIAQANAAASGSATVTLVPPQQAAQTGAIELGTSGGNIHASSTSGNTITCCGGTLGSLLKRNGSFFILSNNHVMADSDTASATDAIIQPALIDTGTCTSTGTSTVANLTQWFNLESNASNPVDAAISQIVSGKVDTSGKILLLGSTTDANGIPTAGQPLQGSGKIAGIGDAVAKSGRSSGLTCSTVEMVNAAFSVSYQKGCGTGTSFSVAYTNQISIVGGEFSTEGDSGSLIVEQADANPVALLFAGSDTDTVANPIGDVLQAMADKNTGTVPFVVGYTTTLPAGHAPVVAGCTIAGPTSATSTLPTAAISQELKQLAVAARDSHSKELLGLPGVQGIGVGASLDHSGQPAVLLFVSPGTLHSALPTQIDGIRTRIVETSNESSHGVLSEQETVALAPGQATFAVSSLSSAELSRAKGVHTARVDEWMKQPGVQGFGITSSADSTGEAALMIYLIRGVAHNPIPAVIDGVRTRVRESSRIHAGFSHSPSRPGCSVPAVIKADQAKIAATIPPAK
jgi:hypothetical protein